MRRHLVSWRCAHDCRTAQPARWLTRRRPSSWACGRGQFARDWRLCPGRLQENVAPEPRHVPWVDGTWRLDGEELGMRETPAAPTAHQSAEWEGARYELLDPAVLQDPCPLYGRM